MKKLVLVVMTITLVVLTSRCTLTEDIEKLTGALDSASLVLGTPVFDTGVQLQIKNAKTRDYINDAEVSVSITGKDAAIVYDNLGIKSATYKTKFGIVNLIVDPTKINTSTLSTSPIEFDLQVTAPGYSSITQRILLNEKGTFQQSVTLVKLNDAPAGITVAQSSGFVNSNTSGSSTTTGTLEINSGQQALSVQPGVVMKDENGTPITGTVNAQVIYFDPTSSEANDAFPGGLNAVATVSGNQTQVVAFEPVGMFDINLSAGSKKVKTFSNGGLTIKTEVPAGLTNPNTNQPIKENDQVEMWSRDAGSGVWVKEKTASVKNINGKLILEETVTHLSWHLLAFVGEFCEEETTFMIQGTVPVVGIAPLMNVSTTYSNGYLTLNTLIALPVTGNQFNYAYKSRLRKSPGEITFSPLFGQEPVTIALTGLCTPTTHTVTVGSATQNPSLLTVNFDLAISSGPLTVKPSLKISYRELLTTGIYNNTYLIDGKGKMQIKLNTEYTLLLQLGSNEALGELKIESISATKFRITVKNLVFGDQSSSEPVVLEAEKAPDGSLPVVYKVEVDSDVLNQLKP